jgi:hypothetical protein
MASFRDWVVLAFTAGESDLLHRSVGTLFSPTALWTGGRLGRLMCGIERMMLSAAGRLPDDAAITKIIGL